MRAPLPVGAALFVLALLALAQVALPSVAADRLRTRLARSGTVERVAVRAFPAVELLWGEADRVEVRMRSYRASPAALGAALRHSVSADRLDASTAVLSTGLLTLRDARLHAQDRVLSGEALVTDADLRAAVPAPLAVRPIASGGGQLELQGTASLFGATVSARFRLLATEGRLVVAPEGVPFAGLATLTVFADPHLRMDGVGARTAPGGFALTARGHLAG